MTSQPKSPPAGDELDEIILKPAQWQLDDYIKAKAQLNAYILAEVLSLLDYEYELSITDLEKRERQEGVEIPVVSKTDLRNALTARFGGESNS